MIVLKLQFINLCKTHFLLVELDILLLMMTMVLPMMCNVAYFMIGVRLYFDVDGEVFKNGHDVFEDVFHAVVIAAATSMLPLLLLETVISFSIVDDIDYTINYIMIFKP